MRLKKIAVAVSVTPYANAAASPSSVRTYVASSLVGNGMNAMQSRKQTLMNRNVRSMPRSCLRTVWWLTQMIPIVRKLTA